MIDNFKNLSEKNQEFYIALYFCNRHYRSIIATLISLYTEWTSLPKRIKEPLAIQMRLTWWHEQLQLNTIPSNAPPEITILKPYNISDLLTTIEYEYVHRDKNYVGQSSYELFKLIARIMDCQNDADNAGEYGRYYHSSNIGIYPKITLPFKLRFLRIPIILKTHNQSLLHLFYRLIKNFLI
jgi:hypothetical protein